jgi:glycosyltransferase involved in cell wall biosynthesis
MQPPQPSLTVVLLMFNEQDSILSALAEHVTFLEQNLDDWEVIVVDDGSTDAGADIASGFALERDRIRVVSHGVNRGMGAGIATGIRQATKDYFVMNAADGQIPADEIGKLLPLLDGADIALSTYAVPRESRVRGLLSRGFRFYLARVSDIRFELQGLYLFPTAAAREIEPLIRAQTFFFSFELIQRGIERGLTTAATDILVQPRAAGSSKIANVRRIFEVASDALGYGIAKRCGTTGR